jgi:DNA-binding Xre family transcriptional regulator
MGKNAQRRRHYIKEWREFRGRTQEWLADQIGKQTPALQKIENNKVGILLENLENIAEALECDVSDLLRRDPHEFPDLFSSYSRATKAQRQQFDRLAKAMLDPQES